MTLDEQLIETKEIKALLLQGLKNNISSGSLLGYTTNGTKVAYEGATKTSQLLREYNSDIAQLNSLIANNARLAKC